METIHLVTRDLHERYKLFNELPDNLTKTESLKIVKTLKGYFLTCYYSLNSLVITFVIVEALRCTKVK